MGLSQKHRSPPYSSLLPEEPLPSQDFIQQSDADIRRRIATSKRCPKKSSAPKKVPCPRGRSQLRVVRSPLRRPQPLVRVPVAANRSVPHRSQSQSSTPVPKINPPHLPSHVIPERDRAFVNRCDQVVLEGPSPAVKILDRRVLG